MIDLSRDVLVDKHIDIGRLPNGDAYSHECHDVRTCQLREQIRQMERERERQNPT